MSLKNEQTVPTLPANVPSAFDDDLAYRCFPHRFRRIGSPFAYLNDIGLAPILEFIYKGHLLIDVAEAVNVPLLVLRTWVEEEGHLEAIEEAETISAEGYLADGLRRIKTAPTEFELRRAKEMVKHAHFMASKKNKPVYGESVAQKEQPAGVTYVFNIPDQKTAMAAVTAAKGTIIDSTSNRLANGVVEEDAPPQVSVDLGSMFGFGLPPTPRAVHNDKPTPSVMLAHLEADSIPDTPELRLVADRPKRPTATAPDIGPFFEEVE